MTDNELIKTLLTWVNNNVHKENNNIVAAQRKLDEAKNRYDAYAEVRCQLEELLDYQDSRLKAKN